MNAKLLSAIRCIEAHPAVASVAVEETQNGGANVLAMFRVDLPSRWAAAGASQNGVRVTEEVLVEFFPEFPTSAPRFTLREDFPDTLPHIYYHKKGERVPPCITFGDKRDIMHSDGMFRLVDQMSDWLNKAALDELAADDKGWEPSRREVGFNFLELDPHGLFPKPPFGGWRMFSCKALWSQDGKLSMARDPQTEAPLLKATFLEDLLHTLESHETLTSGRVPLVFFWPQVGADNQPEIHAQYKADTVATFAELAEQASEWKCRVAFDDFVSNFNRVLDRSRAKAETMLYLAFPVRRPKQIIGMQSDFEMIAYRMPLSLPAKLSAADGTSVSPVAFISPISGKLLKRTSALREADSDLQMTFVGCGSLGSKVAMHVARAGGRAVLLIDEKRLVAHNVARHALLPEDVARLQSKAERLANIMGSFGAKRPKVFIDDIRTLDFTAARCREFFRGHQSVVINTTGSSAVREFLSAAPFSARILEGALVHQGTAAFLTIEGPDRNPSTTDLVYHAYEGLRRAGVLRIAAGSETSILEVGVGCHSVTIPMSDARLSLVAAGVGQRLLEYGQNGLPKSGVVATSTVGSDGMSIAWSIDNVSATHLARVHDDAGWTVHVLGAAHEKIVSEVAQHPGVETGGLIVGSVSSLTRKIFITDVLPAAPDSVREPARFVLGTQGTVEKIREYEVLGGRTLWCLGTWHSHLAVSGPSQMDRDTAKSLKGLIRRAALLLIRHPAGYVALVEEGFSV
ncbi:molybdopterin/thiamine biosynthesis adenylyltransferase [Paraburkholderia sp. GAS333]|uniref:ThiF family adenylyltransferase n=1 Tax=Paraburkholderia sp. GAS333 TaxID=3156279 RepID=UPI003D207476